MNTLRGSKMDRNYRRYQSIGSDLIVVGIIFMGMYTFSFEQWVMDEFFIGSIFLVVLSLMFIAAGVFVKWWASKNKPTEPEQELSDEEANKRFNRAFGKWMIRIAAFILCINVFCRVTDAIESKNYIQVMGTVTDTYSTSSWNAGKRSYNYHVRVDYQPQGWAGTTVISESHSSSMFYEGQTVPVLYRENATYDEYIAKKDWMTGAYLPAENWYNVPFVIGIVLFVLGFLAYTDSPVLEWIERADQILREKTKAKKPKTIKNKAFKKTILMRLIKYEIPQEYQNRNDVLVCHYCTGMVGFLMGLLFSIGAGSCIIFIASLTDGNIDVADLMGSLMMSVCMLLLSGAGGLLYFKHMKNWTVIFHKDGVWYRSISGKVYNYTDAEVEWYMIASRIGIVLGTEPKRVNIKSFTPNYGAALQWVRQKYRKL